MIEQLGRDSQLLIDLARSSLRQRGLLKRGPIRFWHYKTREGFEFKLRRDVCDSAIFIETWWLNAYLKGLDNIREGAVVIDVGAHIGFFSVLMTSKAKDIKVLAFEPNPDNFTFLKENIKINHLENKIFPTRVALADKGGKRIRFYTHPDNLGMHSAVFSYKKLWEGGEAPSFEAGTISLEEIFQKNRLSQCDFLKMDCEGCEYPVLLSTPEGVLRKIRSLTLEYHPGGDIQAVKRRLENAGFSTRFDQPVPLVGRLIHAPLLKAWRRS